MKKMNQSRQEISRGIIRADLISAKQAINYFLEKGNKDIKNIAAYHLQQAAEKLIKYQIYASDFYLDHAKIYTHNLEALILYADSIGVAINVPKQIRDNALTITKWEAGSRYGLGLSVRIDTLQKIYAVVEEWYQQVR